MRFAALADPRLLLIGATLLAHGGDLANGFAWDDQFIVVDNPATKDLSRLGEVLLSPDMMVPYYRPLCRATYLIDYQVFGLAPAGFHAINVSLHLACVFLFFAWCRRLFGATGPALFGALLLAVHPIHVEAVAFVSARNNLLALVFTLVSVLLLTPSPSPSGGPKADADPGWMASALSGLAWFLALASKEQAAMTLPFLAAWRLGAAAPGRRWRELRWLAPHLLGLIVYLGLRWVALGGPAATEPIGPGLLDRLARNYWVVPSYFRLLVFPDRLSILHELPSGFGGQWWLPLAWLLLAGAVAAVIRTGSTPSRLGLLWFGLNLVPVLGLVPLPSTAYGVMSERFLHFSAVGAWLVMADLFARASSLVRPRTAWAVAALLLVALGARSVARGRDWRDDLALRRSTAEAFPESLLARFDLGVELKDHGDLDGARHEWEAALQLAPQDPGTLTQLGTLAAVQGRLDEAEQRYRAALHGDPELAEAALNLGKICQQTGRLEEAAGHFAQVLRSRSASPELVDQARSELQRLGIPATSPEPTVLPSSPAR